MNAEKKYIIFKKYNKLEKLVFPACHSHYYFARDNGIDFFKVMETGMIIDKKIVIVECKDRRHLERRRDLTLFSEQRLKAREVESRYAYKYSGLREGD